MVVVHAIGENTKLGRKHQSQITLLNRIGFTTFPFDSWAITINRVWALDMELSESMRWICCCWRCQEPLWSTTAMKSAWWTIKISAGRKLKIRLRSTQIRKFSENTQEIPAVRHSNGTIQPMQVNRFSFRIVNAFLKYLKRFRSKLEPFTKAIALLGTPFINLLIEKWTVVGGKPIKTPSALICLLK